MPSTSFSERGSTDTVRSPSATASAAVAFSRRYSMVLLEGGGQAADLVVGLDVDVDVDVTLGDALGGLGDGADRLGQQVRDEQDHEADEDQRDEADDEQRVLQALDRARAPRTPARR